MPLRPGEQQPGDLADQEPARRARSRVSEAVVHPPQPARAEAATTVPGLLRRGADRGGQAQPPGQAAGRAPRPGRATSSSPSPPSSPQGLPGQPLQRPAASPGSTGGRRGAARASSKARRSQASRAASRRWLASRRRRPRMRSRSDASRTASCRRGLLLQPPHLLLRLAARLLGPGPGLGQHLLPPGLRLPADLGQERFLPVHSDEEDDDGDDEPQDDHRLGEGHQQDDGPRGVRLLGDGAGAGGADAALGDGRADARSGPRPAPRRGPSGRWPAGCARPGLRAAASAARRLPPGPRPRRPRRPARGRTARPRSTSSCSCEGTS